jgi:hypothetical protein
MISITVFDEVMALAADYRFLKVFSEHPGQVVAGVI